jgi:large conductance mechanosensitive channel
MAKVWDEFGKFIKRGNIIDLAVGLSVGTAFTVLVKSLVDDVLMPPVGLLLGSVDFANLFVVLKQGEAQGPYSTLAAAREAGAVTWRYGLFVNAVVSFLIVALAVFFVVRAANRFMAKPEAPAAPTTKDCPFCLMKIPLKASRCPYCTSEIIEKA